MEHTAMGNRFKFTFMLTKKVEGVGEGRGGREEGRRQEGGGRGEKAGGTRKGGEGRRQEEGKVRGVG